VEIREPAQFKALGHPLRHKLLITLRQRPATFAQLAAAVGSTKGTVGYHVRILEQAGLVRATHTKRVRGGTEQYFEATSERLTIKDGGAFLIRAALGEMVPDEPDKTVLRHLWLSPAQHKDLVAALKTFGAEYQDQDEETGPPYGLLVSLYRADVPLLPAED
jgi:DNA-binding transcriptional ArsR family regulator